MSTAPVWLISDYLQRPILRCSTSHRSPLSVLEGEPFGGLLQSFLKENHLSILQAVIFTLLLVFPTRYFTYQLVHYQLSIDFQIFSGRIPFYEIHDHTVMLQVIRGQRPSRPSVCDPWNIACEDLGLDDETWALIGKCWNQEPEKRPVAKEVGAFLCTKLGLSGSNSQLDESQNTVGKSSPWDILESIQ